MISWGKMTKWVLSTIYWRRNCQKEVVGIVGPNSTGKTTMVRMIAGEINPMKDGALEDSSYLTNRNM